MDRDRRSLPLQLRDEVAELIERDGMPPGAQLPSEVELAERFSVGRTSIREALKLMEQDGLIDVRHGRGRFVAVAPRLDRPITRLESVTEMMRHQGYAVTNKVLSVGSIRADTATAEALLLEPAAEVIRLERLRLQGTDPLIYSIDLIRSDLLPADLGAIDWSGSLLDLLGGRGYHVVAASARIEAAVLPPAARRAIGRRGTEPWLLLTQTNLADDGTPVLHSQDYHRGDAFQFRVLRRRIG